ncbi:hypothetical protein DICPUDRAFT_41727 [Dictyostelium purpureum]|uniref:D-serine dehydratase n=1 Tax=Dictyostelium purpureum TaxID=5786 RepID=F1A0P1_DICPU|nr:uncharacterized protein DICPUDRAFT_41727 [Dictyostelium purpureum]EGC30243.1 hypothetical protein DICPUDRAFT_41727 [Dictyostelium purpureum]|eukprot:XP_003293235.1 hypothetical protein DICPUDRAFT_41727 [Dictyostelium purpureum]
MQKDIKIEDLTTPCVLVLDPVVRNNCIKMNERAHSLGVDVRAHMKTHKTVEIGKYQFEKNQNKDQVIKIIVSTLSEARFFSKDFSNILYATPISPNKVDEAYQIHLDIERLNIMFDNIEHVNSMVEFSKTNPKYSKRWSVFLKIDCGYHRAGASPELQSTTDLVHLITKGEFKDYFDFQGIYSHSGHSYKCNTPEEIKELAKEEARVTGDYGKKLKSLGYHVENVSIGSTPVCSHLPDDLTSYGVTEIHPGNYTFYDLMQMELGNCSIDDVGVHVLATIVSVYPERNEILIDAGSLALSSDPGCTHLKNRNSPNFGIVYDDTNLRIVAASQEVSKVQSSNGSPIDFSKYKIGSKIRIIPNHSCLTAAMFSNYHVINKDNNIFKTFKPNKYW